MTMINRFKMFAATGVALLFFATPGCEENPLNKQITDAFALNCPGRTEHFANVDTFIVIGHRGAAGLEVENTIEGFQRAMDEGANAIELDFVMTKDHEIVIWHDWDPEDAIALARESGSEYGSKYRPRNPPIYSEWRRQADEYTLEEFREHHWYTTKSLIDKERMPHRIPTLTEFMEWAQNQPKLYYVFFDIKLPPNKDYLADEMMLKMDSIVQAFNPKWKGVYITPHQTVWQRIGELLRDAPLSFDVDLGSGTVSDDYCSISSSTHAETRGGSGFATTMHPFAWTERPWKTLKGLLMCDLARRDAPRLDGSTPVVEKVVAATINDEDKMRCLVDLGIDGLMTDDPALLARIAREAGKTVQ